MTRESDSERESQLSSDRETIHGWTRDHDVVPVRFAETESESGRILLVEKEKQTADHEEVTWDEFYEEIDRENKAVVYHGAEFDEPFEVLGRSDALERTTIEDEAVEEALLEGEVVTTEVTETTVVERTIVEEASIESEVIDREVAEVDVVDAALLTREAVECEVTDLGPTPTNGDYEATQFESGYRSDDYVEVAAQIDEVWGVTKEIVERLTIESRLTDMDVTETDTVEDDAVETSIDVEGVQRTVLDSELIDTDAATTEIIESGSIESEFGEGEVVRTQLFERKTVEEEVNLEKQYTGDIAGGETISTSTINREVIESDIVGGEEIEFEIETVVDTVTEVEADLEGHSEPEASSGQARRRPRLLKKLRLQRKISLKRSLPSHRPQTTRGKRSSMRQERKSAWSPRSRKGRYTSILTLPSPIKSKQHLIGATWTRMPIRSRQNGSFVSTTTESNSISAVSWGGRIQI